jgi:phosphoribosyl-AMP cyclohydrolase
MTNAPADWLDAIAWDDRGLVTVVTQEALTGKVLMVAWMNREALERTLATGQATYWSRSRQRLWRKGEESGHTQTVREIRSDCDGDTVLLEVEQHGGIACHTGRHACFFNRLDRDRDGRPQWMVVEPVLEPPRGRRR